MRAMSGLVGRATVRDGRGEFDILLGAPPDLRMVERWCAASRSIHVRCKIAINCFRFTRLPRNCCRGFSHLAESDGKGKVTLTPDLEKAMLDIFVRSMSVRAPLGKLGALLLQLSPAFSRASTSWRSSTN